MATTGSGLRNRVSIPSRIKLNGSVKINMRIKNNDIIYEHRLQKILYVGNCILNIDYNHSVCLSVNIYLDIRGKKQLHYNLNDL